MPSLGLGSGLGLSKISGGSRAAYNSTVLSDNPILYFKLDESGTGNFINYGSAGATHNGVPTSTFITRRQVGPITSDPENYCILNDVGVGYIVPNYTLGNSLTAELWIKGAIGGSFVNFIMQDTGNRMWGFKSFSGDIYGIWFPAIVSVLYSNAFLNDNAWHHIAYTLQYNSVANTSTQSIYVDGVLRASNTNAGQLTNTTSEFRFVCSGDANAGGLGYGGRVARPAVYASALSVARLQAHIAAAN